jgi:hypothetical protein
MQTSDAVAALSVLPELLATRLYGLSDPELRLRPSEDHFSLLEQVCHLRDIEVEGYGRRLALLLEQAHPELPDLDGTALAKARRYNGQELAPALEAFITARQANLARLRALKQSDLGRDGHLEGVGEVTVTRLLELWVAHDGEHSQEIESLLASLRDPAQRPKPSRSLIQP